MEHNQLENNLIKFDFHYVLISKIAGPRGLHPLQVYLQYYVDSESIFLLKVLKKKYDGPRFIFSDILKKGYSILDHSDAFYILQNGIYKKTFHPFSSWLCSHKLMLIFSNC